MNDSENGTEVAESQEAITVMALPFAKSPTAFGTVGFPFDDEPTVNSQDELSGLRLFGGSK